MRIHFPERLGLPQASAASHDHNGIKKVSRLVLICSGLLVLASIVLVATALQVVQSIDRADLVAERQRAANAIDAAVAAFGPLTEDGAVLMGQVAGLRDARLVRGLQQDPSVQQVPLLAGQGPAGSYLAWTRTSLGEGIFRQFAPIRLPFAAGTMLIILLLMLRVRHLVGEIDSQRRLAHRQSRSDPLTGLANRLALDGRLEQLVGEGTRFATLALDLDLEVKK